MSPFGQLVEIEYRHVEFLVKDDAQHPAFVRVAEDQDVKGAPQMPLRWA